MRHWRRITHPHMELEDKRTVYDACVYHLIPKEDEPSVCMMHDWIYLPSAYSNEKSIKNVTKTSVMTE